MDERLISTFRGYVGRLAKESIGGSITSYAYDGDRLVSALVPQEVSFSHDHLGRMTFDGLSGQTITYNGIDLVKNIAIDGTVLVNVYKNASHFSYSLLITKNL